MFLQNPKFQTHDAVIATRRTRENVVALSPSEDFDSSSKFPVHFMLHQSKYKPGRNVMFIKQNPIGRLVEFEKLLYAIP